MFSCDYNGWADVPEEEREAIDAFEAAEQAHVRLVYATRLLQPVIMPPPLIPERQAA